MDKTQTLLFFGPSGAGKGTQVDLLMEYLEKNTEQDVIYIEMGALLRAMVKGGGFSANLTNEVISNGKLMPAFLPNYLFTKQLVDNFTGIQHIIADAVVRRVSQAKAFDDAMVFYGREDYAVIAMDVKSETTLERLLARGRNDDTEEKIMRRLDWYKKDVLPALDTLRERGRTIYEIDGDRDVHEIHMDILQKTGLK